MSILERKKTKVYSNLLVTAVYTNSKESRRRKTLIGWNMTDEKELLGKGE